ncbi:hypothetical protein J7I80_22900 [Bacillus sp. ISL-41]|jgi:fibronectin type 3 domain-containing protein|uniref:hypothetical protein n=1 Tax=Bacillus sp. ISL-41 TaxID=2819127 RepID=UPI001BED0F43|nr:hypothetical protein [Bacillus sp. ISL-41]MBT2645074.1 hypothetical protein [Bacillus sp. ISL-41]
MSLLKSLTGRYEKFSGTSENNRDDQLKTRYYKANFNQMFQTVEELLKADSSYKITSVSKDHGELSAELKGKIPAFLTATVITTKPFETAVDLHISTEKFSLAGINPALKQELIKLYEKLDKTHTFIGSGKYGNQ